MARSARRLRIIGAIAGFELEAARASSPRARRSALVVLLTASSSLTQAQLRPLTLAALLPYAGVARPAAATKRRSGGSLPRRASSPPPSRSPHPRLTSGVRVHRRRTAPNEPGRASVQAESRRSTSLGVLHCKQFANERASTGRHGSNIATRARPNACNRQLAATGEYGLSPAFEEPALLASARNRVGVRPSC
jgi:hypothetical protein